MDQTSGAGELRLKSDDPALKNLTVGKIVVAEPVEGIAPYGFLQRIEAARQEGGETVLVTKQATLEEAIDEADIEYQIQLSPADLDSTATNYEGVTAQGLQIDQLQQGLSYDFSVDFDQVLIDLDGDHETKEDQLRIDGSFAFGLGIDAKIKIGTKYLVIPTLEHLKFLAYLKESADLKLEGALVAQFDKEVEVATFYFGAVTVPVGPVPVVFSIDVKITVGARGEVKAHLLATATQSLDISAGVEYKSGDGWTNLSSFESEFDFPTPIITAAGSARAFAKPHVGLKVYGIAGPYAFSNVFVEADAAYDRDPFWNLVAGVDLGVGFKADLPVIGEIANWSKDFELFRKKLGSSPNQAPTLEIIFPADGARLRDGERMEFRAKTNDREQSVVSLSLRQKGVNEVVATASAQRDVITTLMSDRLCLGSYEFELTATDAQGAKATARRSVIVENRIPQVSLRTDLLEDQPIYPGGYLTAFASASDVGCAGEGTTPRNELIEWYVNDERVGETGTLLYRIPVTYGAGDLLLLEARYDDGTDVGVSGTVTLEVSTKPAGLDLPPTVFILYPLDGGDYLINVDYSLHGMAVDHEDGPLSGSSLKWEFEALDGGWIELPAGQEKFKLTTIYGGALSPNVPRKVRLTAMDSAGQESSAIVTISGTVPL